MSNFCFIRYQLDDIWHKIVCNRFKAIICSIIAVAGVAVGVAFFVLLIMVGGIGTDVISLKNFRRRVRRTNNFLISYILIFICIALCNMLACTKVFILLCYFYFGIVLRRQYCGIDCVFYCLGRSVRRSSKFGGSFNISGYVFFIML